MPLHDLKTVQALVAVDQWFYLNEVDGRSWYGEAWKFMDRMGWEDADAKAMFLGLTDFDFQKTVSNCRIHALPGIGYIDADQYEIHWDDENQCRHNKPQPGCISISLKIALIQDDDGSCMGLVTMHSSGSK
jgi:hypothetical protein